MVETGSYNIAKAISKSARIERLDSFCCLHLDTGIKVVLFTQTVMSLFYMVTTFCNIVLNMPTIGYNMDQSTQAFNAAYALAGLPFLASGFSGVWFQVEHHLRVYWLWLGASTALETVFLIVGIVMDSPCSMSSKKGSAALCALSQISDLGILFTYLALMFFVLFAVWSKCDELRTSATDSVFDKLVEQRSAALKEAGAHSTVSTGLFGTGPSATGPAVSLVYGSLASPTLGGGVPLFGGSRHDSFPALAV